MEDTPHCFWNDCLIWRLSKTNKNQRSKKLDVDVVIGVNKKGPQHASSPPLSPWKTGKTKTRIIEALKNEKSASTC
jgi:hypothetical protein